MFRKRREILEAGAKTPAFELKNLQGALVSLQSVLETRPALFAFFKSSCPVCQLTLPYLERMAPSVTVQFVGISQDDANTTKAFNGRFGITFPTLLDELKAG